MKDKLTTGLPVLHLDTEGPASKAGVRVGDIVIAIDNQPIHTHADYILAVDGKRSYSIDVLRGSRQLVTCHVKLGEQTEPPQTEADYQKIIERIEGAVGEGNKFNN